MNYEKLMLRAISNANFYKFTAKPNPVVGAILVKGEEIISEGYHEKFGQNHAEINAINLAKKKINKNFSIWEMNKHWNFTRYFGFYKTNQEKYYQAEKDFEVDFNGDGTIGYKLESIESKGNIELLKDIRKKTSLYRNWER